MPLLFYQYLLDFDHTLLKMLIKKTNIFSRLCIEYFIKKLGHQMKQRKMFIFRIFTNFKTIIQNEKNHLMGKICEISSNNFLFSYPVSGYSISLNTKNIVSINLKKGTENERFHFEIRLKI